jgi:hypothetical protein
LNQEGQITPIPHGSASVYLKANKDYNNKFLEHGKILKVGRSPELSWRLLHLPSWQLFSAGAETYYFKFQVGHT